MNRFYRDVNNRARRIFCWLLLSSSTLLAQTKANAQKLTVRPAEVAGSFYPADPQHLRADIKKYLSISPKSPRDNIRAIIAPHAGYVYDYPARAEAYKALGNKKYRKVFIIASNHTEGIRRFKFAIPGHQQFATPLGLVTVDPLTQGLLKPGIVEVVEPAHSSHIIEVQLPFLQYLLADKFTIIPIVTGAVDSADIDWLATRINSLLDDDTLIIVSADLSHYHPYEKAKLLDEGCAGSIVEQRLQDVARCETCGREAIYTLLNIAGKRGWQAELLHLMNSADSSGTKDRVVGYTAIQFYDEVFSEQIRTELLKASRSILNSYINTGKAVKPNLATKFPITQKARGCFVTLKKNGQLRGCIGHIIANASLFDCISENTINAATRDGRFKPVDKKELEDLQVEISILSLPQPINERGEALISFLIPKTHGVILKRGNLSSTYLPQVWEDIADKSHFLSSLCQKAQMPTDCWQKRETEVFIYEATHFSEPKNKK